MEISHKNVDNGSDLLKLGYNFENVIAVSFLNHVIYQSNCTTERKRDCVSIMRHINYRKIC